MFYFVDICITFELEISNHGLNFLRQRRFKLICVDGSYVIVRMVLQSSVAPYRPQYYFHNCPFVYIALYVTLLFQFFFVNIILQVQIDATNLKFGNDYGSSCSIGVDCGSNIIFIH